MTAFSSSTTAEALVPAPREEIWAVLTDPDLLCELTPFLKRITADGDRWRWEMAALQVLGVGVSPAFTERMVFDDLERIEFHHEPPAGTTERSGVDGWYQLVEEDGGTRLATSLTITIDLPLPRVSSSAVTVAMRGVMATMGDRFSRNLLRHLDIER